VPSSLDSSRSGADAPVELFGRAELRDVLAWMRLLNDPRDTAAAVRALTRPPIELRQVDLARVIQIIRRRRLDPVAALTAATESSQIPPHAQERIQRFLELYRWAAGALDTLPPELFVAHLVQRMGLPRRRLVVADTEVPEPIGSAEEDGVQERDPLHAALLALRAEVLDSVARISSRLGELRLDTELDVSHGVVRYLELLKLAALLERPVGQGLEEALGDINARLLGAATPLQREIFQTSTLDQMLLAAEGDGGQGGRVRIPALLASEEASLEAFLPRSGEGLSLSASDIETYRSCPLRYKFARVLRIPSELTLDQRFGIVVHQTLERYHSAEADRQALPELLELLDAAWLRAALGDGEEERRLHAKARGALTRYHERLCEGPGHPEWFERPFAFRLGPHQLRGRVDRVDLLPDGTYELIDYKTGYPRTASELRDDIQLSLYSIAAREAWGLPDTSRSYYYLLDDQKVPVSSDPNGADWVADTVLEVGERILAQDFEPTPSPSVCARCDFRVVCPYPSGGSSPR
jgi:DNA helicase II / ATP-dependent DNA helicase PcrA